jgi:hypothetical protein
MSPANERAYQAHLWVCHACAEAERFRARTEGPTEPGTHIVVTKEAL